MLNPVEQKTKKQVTVQGDTREFLAKVGKDSKEWDQVDRQVHAIDRYGCGFLPTRMSLASKLQVEETDLRVHWKLPREGKDVDCSILVKRFAAAFEELIWRCGEIGKRDTAQTKGAVAHADGQPLYPGYEHPFASTAYFMPDPLNGNSTSMRMYIKDERRWELPCSLCGHTPEDMHVQYAIQRNDTVTENKQLIEGKLFGAPKTETRYPTLCFNGLALHMMFQHGYTLFDAASRDPDCRQFPYYLNLATLCSTFDLQSYDDLDKKLPKRTTSALVPLHEIWKVIASGNSSATIPENRSAKKITKYKNEQGENACEYRDAGGRYTCWLIYDNEEAGLQEGPCSGTLLVVFHRGTDGCKELQLFDRKIYFASQYGALEKQQRDRFHKGNWVLLRPAMRYGLDVARK